MNKSSTHIRIIDMFSIINIPQKTTVEKIQDGDLYTLLSVCSKEDLEPIVKVILGTRTNRLARSENYKKHKSEHTKYYKEIGDEICLFGGNTVGNLFRGGRGISYSELLTDVCKKLDIPDKKDDVIENEERLLKIYVEHQLKHLTKEEQDKILIEAQQKAKKEGIGLLAETSKLLASRLLLGPVGWFAVIPSMADPAFRITIPCVIHIAYLRKKYLEIEKSKHQMPEQKISEEANYVTVGHNENALIITSSENETPILSLAQIPTPQKNGQWRSVSSDDKDISRLNSLLQSVPSILTAENVANTKYMEVVINGDLAKAADGVSFRGWSIADGKIQEHAKLFESNGLSSVVNVGALWQIASVVVAQKHMADISEKLSDIKDGVDKIIRFQENERMAKILAILKYFVQIAPSIISKEKLESFRDSLEKCEKDLIKIQEHLVKDIGYEITNAEIKDKDTFGSEGIEKTIVDHQNKVKKLYEQLTICIQVRACGWQLLAMYSGEDILKESRKKSIIETINNYFSSNSDYIKKTEQFMRTNIHKINAHTSLQTTINKRKIKLIEKTEELVEEIITHGNTLLLELQVAEAIELELKSPVKLMLKIENEKIVEMCSVQ